MVSHVTLSRPVLKNDVELQLRTAFQEGNWSTVMRLADRRAKGQNDLYYEAVKLCGESQSENPIERCAALVAVDSLVRNGAVPKDFETLDLLEWAHCEAQPLANYAQTIGVLRSRWAKLNPRSPAVVACLQACLQRWDLVNAQQIAAVLDKLSNSGDRRYMYWSITLTYLLSISPQCPVGKQNIYAMLSFKQLERAAELTQAKGEINGEASNANSAERDIRLDEELNLFHKVLVANGTPAEFTEMVQNPVVGVLRQFKAGKKHLFLEALDTLEARGQWDVIYEVCYQAFQTTDQDGSPSLLASNWRVWRRFINAAGNQPDRNQAITSVRDSLQRFVAIRSKVAQMYVKNLGLALLDLAFLAPPVDGLLSREADGTFSPRVSELGLFLEQHYSKASAFDDVRGYIELLSFGEAKQFLDSLLPGLEGDKSDSHRHISLKVLQHKLRYFLTTCPQTLARQLQSSNGTVPAYRCKFCGDNTRESCQTCLEKLMSSAASLYENVTNDAALAESIPRLEKDPGVDLTLVAAMCLLKLSAISPITGLGGTGSRRISPMSGVDISRLLQTAVLLDSQLHKTPNDVPLRLLLVKIYILIGCGTLAHQLWLPMDVKRTIQDALSPLFFDRISSFSPVLFHSHAGKPPMEALQAYYRVSLRDSAPVKVWDAFSAGSYTSILDLAAFNDRLRTSCTRVMTVVEDRRAARAFGGKIDDLVDVPLFSDFTDQTIFVNVTDHGSLPNFESSRRHELADLIQLGPGLSNERSHLGLLAEQYLELISFKAHKDHRPSKPSEVAPRELSFLVEALASLNTSFTNFLHLEDTPDHLTKPEGSYYLILSLLCAVLETSLLTTRSDPTPPTFSLLISSLKTALSSLHTASTATPPSPLAMAPTFFALSDQHATATLRDAALAIKYSASFVLAFHEREAARDRSGKASLHKVVVNEMKALEALGAKILDDIKQRVKALKETLGEPGWLDRVAEWTFGPENQGSGGDAVAEDVLRMVGGREVMEDWAGRVLESWREGVRGWVAMKME